MYASITSLSQEIEDKLALLLDLWKEMGFQEEMTETRIANVENHLLSILDDMISEENSTKQSLIHSVDKSAKEQLKLSKELGVEMEQPPESLSLIELEKFVRSRTEDLNRQKDLKLQELIVLKKQDESLSLYLSLPPYSISSTAIPTITQLHELKAHILKYKSIKEKRLGVYIETRLTIIELMSSLEMEPRTSFERLIVCEDEEAFPLTEANIVSCQEICLNLEERRERVKREAQDLRVKIQKMNSKLELNDIDEFLLSTKGSFNPSVLSLLKNKLAELSILKMSHLQRFVTDIRSELKVWWSKCLYEDSYPSASCSSFYPHFISEYYTEELYQAHEEELARIQNYYTSHSHLFSLLGRRRELWKQRLELEAKTKDPNRFKGKSTNFLREEKDRKRVNNLLPKLERELDVVMTEYAEEHGEEFKVGGIPYNEYKNLQVYLHESNLEIEKRKKAEAKRGLLIHETHYGTIKSATLPSGKRKAICTPQRSNIETKRIRPSASLVRSSNTSSKSSITLRRRLGGGDDKRRKIANCSEDASFIAGNQMPTSSLAYMSSITGDTNPFAYSRMDNIACSTLCDPNETPGRLRTPRRKKLNVPLTPVSRSKSVFKTPSSRILTPANRSNKITIQTKDRKGKNLPILF